MTKCLVCNKTAAPGSMFCSTCGRLIRYEYRNSRKRAFLRVWDGNPVDKAGLAVPKGPSNKLGAHIDCRPARNAGMVVWATMVESLELETEDGEFTAVLKRLLEGERTAD